MIQSSHDDDHGSSPVIRDSPVEDVEQPTDDPLDDARAVLDVLVPIAAGGADPPDELRIDLSGGRVLTLKSEPLLGFRRFLPAPQPHYQRTSRRESGPRAIRRTRAGASRDGPSSDDDPPSTGPVTRATRGRRGVVRRSA
jgi:hypothetical protein